MVGMSKGLGRRQRDILAKLAAHHDNPPDYNGSWVEQHKLERDDNGVQHWHGTGEWVHHKHPEWMHDRYPQWMTVAELVSVNRDADVESTRRAVRNLETAGLVETRYIWRGGQRGQRHIGIQLTTQGYRQALS